MKYNWSHVRKVLHDTAIASMKTDNETRECARYLAIETDDFHPFDTDGDLQDALDRIKTEETDVHKIVRALENVDESVEICVEEICDKIKEYFSNSWNHGPGYKPPVITFDYPPCGSKIIRSFIDNEGAKILDDLNERVRADTKRLENERKNEAKALLIKHQVTSLALVFAFNKHHKLHVWLRKKIASCKKKNRKPCIRDLSEHVAKSLLVNLRFPWHHRRRATDMIWRRVMPLVKAEIEKENA